MQHRPPTHMCEPARVVQCTTHMRTHALCATNHLNYLMYMMRAYLEHLRRHELKYSDTDHTSIICGPMPPTMYQIHYPSCRGTDNQIPHPSCRGTDNQIPYPCCRGTDYQIPCPSWRGTDVPLQTLSIKIVSGSVPFLGLRRPPIDFSGC